MTRHRDLLRCPHCGRALASVDGMGAIDERLLSQWRVVRDEHLPSCSVWAKDTSRLPDVVGAAGMGAAEAVVDAARRAVRLPEP